MTALIGDAPDFARALGLAAGGHRLPHRVGSNSRRRHRDRPVDIQEARETEEVLRLAIRCANPWLSRMRRFRTTA